MSESDVSSRPPLSATEFLALHRQLSALVRTGLPVERFLDRWNVGRSRAWKKRVQEVAERLRQGCSWEEALQVVESELSPAYRAILDFGYRTGNPAAALDGLTRFGERVLAIRNQLVVSLSYPLFVLLLSLGVVFGFLHVIWPPLKVALQDWKGEISPLWGFLDVCQATSFYWTPVLVATAVLAFIGWILASRRSRLIVPAWAERKLGWFPVVGRLLRDQQVAVFVDLLSLAVRQGVPVDVAVRLAGGVFASSDWQKESAELASALAEQDWRRALRVPENGRISQDIRWLLVRGVSSPRLADSLANLADEWQARCDRLAHLFRSLAVPVVVVGVGAFAVGCATIVIWLPWWSLLFQIASFRV